MGQASPRTRPIVAKLANLSAVGQFQGDLNQFRGSCEISSNFVPSSASVARFRRPFSGNFSQLWAFFVRCRPTSCDSNHHLSISPIAGKSAVAWRWLGVGQNFDRWKFVQCGPGQELTGQNVRRQVPVRIFAGQHFSLRRPEARKHRTGRAGSLPQTFARVVGPFRKNSRPGRTRPLRRVGRKRGPNALGPQESALSRRAVHVAPAPARIRARIGLIRVPKAISGTGFDENQRGALGRARR